MDQFSLPSVLLLPYLHLSKSMANSLTIVVIYTHTHTCTHTNMYVCMYVYLYVFMHIYKYNLVSPFSVHHMHLISDMTTPYWETLIILLSAVVVNYLQLSFMLEYWPQTCGIFHVFFRQHYWDFMGIVSLS